MEEFFNISKWAAHNINYWGIPKCANTSVKHALIGSTNFKDYILLKYKTTLAINKYLLLKDTHKWVHDPLVCRYIDKKEALSNGLINITVIRNPIERFKSQFKYNLKFNLVDATSIECLLNHIEQLDEESRNIHFKSQAYFITDTNSNIITDYVFKTENIEYLEKFLAINIPKINTISGDIWLSHTQIQKIEDIYTKDFEIFESN